MLQTVDIFLQSFCLKLPYRLFCSEVFTFHPAGSGLGVGLGVGLCLRPNLDPSKKCFLAGKKQPARPLEDLTRLSANIHRFVSRMSSCTIQSCVRTQYYLPGSGLSQTVRYENFAKATTDARG